MMNVNELTRLNACVNLHRNEGDSENQRLPLGQSSRRPLHAVDVFRDLGMKEEIIAAYLSRWRWIP